MKTKKTMITTLLITFGLLAGTASAASPGEKVSLQKDRITAKIMQGERNPLHVIPRYMMNPEQPLRWWPEGNPHRLDHDTSSKDILM
jgi:hypothetical protein